MDSGIRLCPATEVSEEALAVFYRRIDPVKAPFRSRHWRWLYRVDWPQSVSPPLVATIGDEVVGHAGLIPVNVQRGQDVRLAHWFVDFWILDEHQRKGIGIAMTRAWMELCPLHITFCNDKSMGVFRKFGWVERRHTRLFRLPLKPELHPRVQRPGLQQAVQVAGAAGRLLARAMTIGADVEVGPLMEIEQLATLERRDIESLHVPRTAEFLRWRLGDCPTRNEYLVFRQPRQSDAVAVARVTKAHGYDRLTIVTMAVKHDRPDVVRRLLAGIVRWGVQQGMGEIVYMTSDATMGAIVRRWLPLQSSALFASHANDDEGVAYLGGQEHFWEALDSDVDLSIISSAQ